MVHSAHNPRASLGSTLWTHRLTPSNSPAPKPLPVRSARSTRNEAGLRLQHVVGTTASAANSIDTLPSRKSLTFTAGAAAVLATFDDDLNCTQRFYRARPGAVPLNPSPAIYEPSTPTEKRRATTFVREGTPGSPYTPKGSDLLDTPGGKSWSAKERVNSATCVSFSPDGKYLAIGETGYRPRVLIFSTSHESSPDIPLTSLSDHTFGVKCVAFSPDSQYLASLGNANDGFLYIWRINSRNASATLFASNKCTSNIHGIHWMGTNLVTFGTRHVKLWRLEDTGPPTPGKLFSSFLSQNTPKKDQRILAGRNCLLGPLLEGIFTCAVALSDSKAIICSDSGNICLLDDSGGRQSFTSIGAAGFNVTAASRVSGTQIHLAGKHGVFKTFDTDNLPGTSHTEIASRSSSTDEGHGEVSSVIALAPLGDYSVSVDSNRFIRLLKPLAPDVDGTPEIAVQLPGHGGPVLGVRPCHTSKGLNASFFTWSADGMILFWNANGRLDKSIQIEVEQPKVQDEPLNELRVVRLCGKTSLVVGDKFGVLRLLDLATEKELTSLRAHAGEITDIAVLEKDQEILVATSSRDRTVQVFRRHGQTCDLIQTLDEHVGAVTGLVFTSDGKYLISCSSDRTVVVREALSRDQDGSVIRAFAIRRTVTLKATPISMTIPNGREDILWISTIDRNVHKYDLRNGHYHGGWKVSDSEGGDAVVLSSIACIPSYPSHGTCLITGVSTTDKSIRVYEESGLLLGRDWGHTEGVTDLTIIKSGDGMSRGEDGVSLVTVAADGTVFIWAFGVQKTQEQDISQSMELMGLSSPRKDLLVHQEPLRRVLSQNEMARFQDRSSGSDDGSSHIIKKPLPAPIVTPRGSRISLAQTPRLDPSPIHKSNSEVRVRRRATKAASPSPPASPRTQRPPVRKASNSALSATPRTRLKGKSSCAALSSSASESILTTSTDSICRDLRGYRQKLAACDDGPSPEALKSLARELDLTAEVVGERAARAWGAKDWEVLGNGSGPYVDRPSRVMNEKFRAGLAREVHDGGLVGGRGWKAGDENRSGEITPPDSRPESSGVEAEGEDEHGEVSGRPESISEEH